MQGRGEDKWLRATRGRLSSACTQVVPRQRTVDGCRGGQQHGAPERTCIQRIRPRRRATGRLDTWLEWRWAGWRCQIVCAAQVGGARCPPIQQLRWALCRGNQVDFVSGAFETDPGAYGECSSGPCRNDCEAETGQCWGSEWWSVECTIEAEEYKWGFGWWRQ
jgi:hypothetical protein